MLFFKLGYFIITLLSYFYIYIYKCLYIYVYIHIYIYLESVRRRLKDSNDCCARKKKCVMTHHVNIITSHYTNQYQPRQLPHHRQESYLSSVSSSTTLYLAHSYDRVKDERSSDMSYRLHVVFIALRRGAMLMSGA